jgi:hypothetical protein
MRPSHVLAALVPLLALAAPAHARQAPVQDLVARLKAHPQLSTFNWIERDDLRGLWMVFHQPSYQYARGFEDQMATLLPLKLACDAKSYAEHRGALIKKVGPAAEKLIKAQDMAEIVHAHVWTLVHYLHEGENGKYRYALGTYLKSALSGDGSFAAFERAFPGVDVSALEGAYFTWLFEQCRVLAPSVALDPIALKGLGSAKPAAAAATGAGSFDMNKLALAEDAHEARHASVLGDIRAGRFEGAILELEELRKDPRIGDWGPRLDREIERCKAFLVLREKHFASLAASGDKFTFEHEGKKVTTKIKSVAEGKLFLDDNKAKLATLAIAELDPADVAKGFGKALGDLPEAWARWYPAVLAGDAKATKMIKGAGPAAELKKDAEAWYPGALKLGEAVSLLQALVERGEPYDPAAAQACLDGIVELRTRHGDVEPVKERADSLHLLATVALRRLWTPDKISEATSAKVEPLPDGRVRLTYEFEAKGEVGDFHADHTYFGVWRANLTDRKVADKPSFTVERGALRVQGAACVRQRWSFADQLLVKYDVSFEGLDADTARTPLFALGICDDKQENFAWCQGFGSLYANDVRSKFVKTDSRQDNFAIQDGVVYPLEFELAAGTLTTRDNGEKVKEAAGVPHKSGGVFFYVHSDPFVLLERLVIEGKPDMATVEQAWVDRKLEQLAL